MFLTSAGASTSASVFMFTRRPVKRLHACKTPMVARVKHYPTPKPRRFKSQLGLLESRSNWTGFQEPQVGQVTTKAPQETFSSTGVPVLASLRFFLCK